MKLDAYLLKTDLTEAAFGEKVGLSQPQVNRLRNDKAVPSFWALRRIFEVTKGDVTAEDFHAKPPARTAAKKTSRRAKQRSAA